MFRSPFFFEDLRVLKCFRLMYNQRVKTKFKMDSAVHDKSKNVDAKKVNCHSGGITSKVTVPQVATYLRLSMHPSPPRKRSGL